MRKSWSEEEIDILKNNYALSPKKEIMALLPNRSTVSINHKANRLGLIKELSHWTEVELDILQRRYPYLNKSELLNSLPKKRWTSIRHKAEELGLRCGPDKFYKRNWKTFDSLVLSDIEKGYLAGILDADGSVTIKRNVDRRSNKKYYAPLISIYNTDFNLMTKIRSLIKIGKIYDDRTAKSKNVKHKIKYIYNVGSIRGVKQILEFLTPILIVKRRRAELVLELIRLKEEAKNANATPEIIEIFEEVRRLNLMSNRVSSVN